LTSRTGNCSCLRVVVQFDKPVPAAAKAAIDLEAFCGAA
jgi:hypothetical protein